MFQRATLTLTAVRVEAPHPRQRERHRRGGAVCGVAASEGSQRSQAEVADLDARVAARPVQEDVCGLDAGGLPC